MWVEWNSVVVGSNPTQANFKESVNGGFFCVWLLIEIFRKKCLKGNKKIDYYNSLANIIKLLSFEDHFKFVNMYICDNIDR